MIDLKAMCGDRFRIVLDESAEILGQTKAERLWLYQIPCRKGHIYVHGPDMLGAYCDRPRLFSRLLGLIGVKRHQVGDREMTVTFLPHLLEEVAEALQAKRRANLSEERRAELREMVARFNEGRARDLDKSAT